MFASANLDAKSKFNILDMLDDRPIERVDKFDSE